MGNHFNTGWTTVHLVILFKKTKMLTHCYV